MQKRKTGKKANVKQYGRCKVGKAKHDTALIILGAVESFSKSSCYLPHICLSVRPHGAAPVPLEEFP
jgi:hypothetical protein